MPAHARASFSRAGPDGEAGANIEFFLHDMPKFIFPIAPAGSAQGA
jgi:hypothetical protein